MGEENDKADPRPTSLGNTQEENSATQEVKPSGMEGTMGMDDIPLEKANIVEYFRKEVELRWVLKSEQELSSQTKRKACSALEQIQGQQENGERMRTVCLRELW